jgi:hypothetical protein
MFATKAKTMIGTAFAVCFLSVSAGALAAVNFREGEDGGGTQHTSATANFAGDKKAGGPSSKGPTLSGVVEDATGRPLPKATVFIRTAAPRKGVGVL